jgi:hypothetical protein
MSASRHRCRKLAPSVNSGPSKKHGRGYRNAYFSSGVKRQVDSQEIRAAWPEFHEKIKRGMALAQTGTRGTIPGFMRKTLQWKSVHGTIYRSLLASGFWAALPF